MTENKKETKTSITENRGTKGTFRRLKERRKNHLKRKARQKRRLFKGEKHGKTAKR